MVQTCRNINVNVAINFAGMLLAACKQLLLHETLKSYDSAVVISKVKHTGWKYCHSAAVFAYVDYVLNQKSLVVLIKMCCIRGRVNW